MKRAPVLIRFRCRPGSQSKVAYSRLARDSIANSTFPLQSAGVMDKQERTFWLAAALIFALFAGLLYFPVFSGRIPFPAELVLQFPAWSGATPPTGWSYADIGDLVTFFYP